jgi:hypothetical protein
MKDKFSTEGKTMKYLIREDTIGVGVKTITTFDNRKDAEVFVQLELAKGFVPWIKEVA